MTHHFRSPLSYITLGIVAISLSLASRAAPPMATKFEAPQTSIDYSKLAFYPKRWKEQGVSTELYPWVGEEVVLLTPTNTRDPKVMQAFVKQLDRGWKHYKDIAGTTPRPFKLYQEKPVIAAVPGSRLTCGFGCGMVGATGIEVSNFPADYKSVQRNSQAVPHYYFYEMGRNFYVFGKKHDCFVTGFAVFMRYSCMDELKLIDNDKKTRTAIEKAIDVHAKTDLDFITAFTNAGSLSEKQPRLKGFSGPCDQPVMYASAMLRLQRDYGGDAFTRRFYQTLQKMPAFGQKENPNNAHRQCLVWLVTASYAAGQDVSSRFVDQWRLPVSIAGRDLLKKTDWKSKTLDPAVVIEELLNRK